MIVNSWGDIEDILLSEDNHSIYLSIKQLAKKKQLNFVNSIEKLKLILIALPYDEKRFKIFNLPAIQTCLNSMSFKVEEFIKLYEVFIPQDALKFIASESAQKQLSKFSLSNLDYEDMLLYFSKASQTTQGLVKKRLEKTVKPLFFSNTEVNSQSIISSDENKEWQKSFS